MTDRKHVVVMGAGVTGLTSAIFLAEQGYRVTIIAAHVPGDESIEYTSPWAGAHWRTAATPAEPMICDWDVQTYDYWVSVLENERRDPRLPKSGLKMQDSYHFWDSPPTEDLWWAPYVQDFRQLSPLLEPMVAINAATPAGDPRVTWGAMCRAPSINVPQYLLYLQSKAKTLGVEVIKARLPMDGGLEKALTKAEAYVHSHAQAKKVDLFVNATGLAAAKLCGDTSMYPIRGQTVLVKGEASATRTRYRDGHMAYCIPRPGAGMTILGGTKEAGNWSEEIDPSTTEQILRDNTVLAPELLTAEDGGFEVVSVQCGLRPGRKGGPRMECEVVGDRKVVHAYGHGGSGYQNSIGSARVVVSLVRQSFEVRDVVTARL